MLRSVQYLRGLSALAIVVYHASGAATHYFGYVAGRVNLLWFLSYGVDVFFVISGFIISFMVLERQQERGEFVINRAAKIGPPYWLLTAVFVASSVLSFALPVSFKPGVADVVLSLSLLSWTQNKGPLLYVAWTLQYEVLFYAFVVLIYEPFKRASSVALWVAVVALAVSPWAVRAIGIVHDCLNPLVFLEFTAGVLVCLRLYKGMLWRVSLPIQLAILGVFWLWHEPKLIIGTILGVLMVSGGLLAERRFRKVFGNRLMLMLGDASYSIYLVQVFVLALLAKVLIGLGLQGHGMAYIILGPIITVAVGYLFYRAVDTPLHAASRQLLFRWRRRLAPELV